MSYIERIKASGPKKILALDDGKTVRHAAGGRRRTKRPSATAKIPAPHYHAERHDRPPWPLSNNPGAEYNAPERGD